MKPAASPRRTEYVILGTLTLRPMSGYEIGRFIRGTIAHFWRESFGQIYPALASLEARGFIAGRQEPGARGQRRTIYSLRPAGRRAFREWLALPAAPPIPRYEHSLKLFFGAEAPPGATAQLIDELRARHRAQLAAYQSMETRLRGSLERDPHAPFHLAVLLGGVRYTEMVLAWCDEIETLLSRQED